MNSHIYINLFYAFYILSLQIIYIRQGDIDVIIAATTTVVVVASKDDNEVVPYSLSILPGGCGPNTGISLISLLPYSSTPEIAVSNVPDIAVGRPAIAVSCGRHSIATCYIQFPDPNSSTEFLNMIPLCSGNYTNVSVKNNLILFTGGSGSGQVTPSQIYELSIKIIQLNLFG